MSIPFFLFGFEGGRGFFVCSWIMLGLYGSKGELPNEHGAPVTESSSKKNRVDHLIFSDGDFVSKL